MATVNLICYQYLMFPTLAGCSGNDICNCLSPPLVDIVVFGLSLSGFPSRLQNASTRGGFHVLMKGVLFSTPTDVGFHTLQEFEHRITCYCSVFKFKKGFNRNLNQKRKKSFYIQFLYYFLCRF